MMNKQYSVSSFLLPLVIALFIASGLVSCTGGRQLNYFRNLGDSTIVHLPPNVPEERIIMNGDRLTISFIAKGDATEVLALFNRGQKSGSGSSGGGSTGGGGEGAGGAGYLVVSDSIEFPYIGRIRASGLTARTLKQDLTKRTSAYLKDPIVDVDFVAFKITVIGDVRSPGSFSLPMQRTSILEALAAAGDLQRSAKRYDVHLLRDYNGQRTVTKVDLRDKAVLTNKDVFQIKPNDVIYVQTRPGSLFREDFAFVATIVTLLISVFSIGFSIYNNNK